MNIIAYFTSAGSPATSLSPTIRIRRTDTNALVVTDAAMTNVGDGVYRYSFSPDVGIDYSVRADGGGALASSDRYAFGAISGTAMANMLGATEVMVANAAAFEPRCAAHKVGNVGTIFRLRAYGYDGEILDISAATTLQIAFRPGPKATAFTRNAVLTTDGTDGYFEYVTIVGDLTPANPCWQMEGKIVLPTGTFYTPTVHFAVEERISP